MAKKSTGGEEVVNHYGAVRIRVKGSGNLLLSLFSLDELQQNVLVPVPIQSLTAVEPTRLSNLTQQRAKLEVRITEIYETFQISKIVIFVKPVAKSLPETI